MSKFGKFFRYLLPYWKKEVLVLVLGGLSLVLSLVNPYLTKLIIDKAYGNKDLKLFIILVVIAGAIFVLNSIFTGLVNYLNRYIKLYLNFDLSRKVFKKLQELSYSFFQDTSTGEHLYKVSYDIGEVSRFMAESLPQAVQYIPKSLFILVIIFFLNWHIALFALLLTPFLYIVPFYFARRLKKAFKIWVENYQKIFQRLHDALSHIQLIKVLGKEKSEIKKYINSLTGNIDISLKNTKLEVKGGFAASLASRIILGLIVFYGGYQVITGKMTLGSFSAIALYLSQLAGLQSSLAHFFQQSSLSIVSCERLEKILGAQPEFIESSQAKKVKFSKGNLEFQNVSFGYKQDKLVLNDLSFSVAGGSCVGIVGPSGCGKTTIINIILRLYKPLDGKVLIDGYSIDKIKSDFLYGQTGVVLQESYLWNDTIENNIKYGKENASLQEVKRVAQVAYIDEFIDSLPNGYATVIGENACKISEGQKQRLAIARAVINKPKILILDEPFSSVDAEIEGKIIDNIRNFLQDSTIIVISHRLSTIRSMDLVYFLVGSGKIEIAQHEKLLEDNPRYKKYLARQLKQEE